MKNFQKLILPLLVLLVVALIYFTYFAPQEKLGLFSALDPNNSASKEIRVELVKEKGFTQDPGQGVTIFYAKDQAGVEMLIHGPFEMPPSIEVNSIVTLRGHLHGDYFHASEVLVK